MTDNIKLPPLPEPDHFAFHDFGQGIWIEGGPTGTPFYSAQQVQELMREAVRLNATVPDGYALVPVDAMKRWRDAFAEELSAWDIAPPLHHVQTSHDEIEVMLSAAPAPQPAQQDDDEGDALTIAYLHGYGKGKGSVQPVLSEKDALLRQALGALEAYSKSGYVRHEHPKKYAAGDAVAEAIRNHFGVKND